MTPRELISWAGNEFAGEDLFYGHGTDNADDEAAYLVLASLNIGFDDEDSVLDEPVSASKLEKVRELVRRRIEERKPVAYLLHQAWFAGLEFYVDERVLVPRSPIAELIEEQFCPWLEPSSVKRILDIGTGSACIAVACALAFPQAVVDAVDISSDALIVATENIEKHKLTERINLLQSDLFQQTQGRTYDLIIANPPYVSTDEVNGLPAEYRHEPVLGLEAGEDGMDVVRRLLKESFHYLSEQGVLIVEVGHSQEAFCSAFPDLPVTWLEFEFGGEGVCVLSREDLRSHH